MILLYAILFILFEAIAEALIKQRFPGSIIFRWWLQWIIAIGLFIIWFVIAAQFDSYYVPVLKLVFGFIFVRVLIFNPTYNIVSRLPIGFYGTTKLYDRIMFKLGGFGYFMQIVLGICGIVFLLGWS